MPCETRNGACEVHAGGTYLEKGVVWRIRMERLFAQVRASYHRRDRHYDLLRLLSALVLLTVGVLVTCGQSH